MLFKKNVIQNDAYDWIMDDDEISVVYCIYVWVTWYLNDLYKYESHCIKTAKLHDGPSNEFGVMIIIFNFAPLFIHLLKSYVIGTCLMYTQLWE